MGSDKERILVQVLRMYQRYGIKSVTMDDVAKKLCISKKTLYEYFGDKEDLVRQVVMMENSRWFSIFREAESRGLNAIEELFEVYQVLKKMFHDYNPSMEYDLRKYYPDLAMKLRDIRRKMIYESSYRNMNKGKREGLYRKDLNSKIMARFHLYRIENIGDTDLISLSELTSFKVFHEIFVYHLHGIMSNEGRVLFEENYRKFKDGNADQPS
jgi:AcrR family transcriptional regulator